MGRPWLRAAPLLCLAGGLNALGRWARNRSSGISAFFGAGVAGHGVGTINGCGFVEMRLRHLPTRPQPRRRRRFHFVLPSRAHSELPRGRLTSVEHTATASGDWPGNQSFKKQQKSPPPPSSWLWSCGEAPCGSPQIHSPGCSSPGCPNPGCPSSGRPSPGRYWSTLTQRSSVLWTRAPARRACFLQSHSFSRILGPVRQRSQSLLDHSKKRPGPPPRRSPALMPTPKARWGVLLNR